MVIGYGLWPQSHGSRGPLQGKFADLLADAWPRISHLKGAGLGICVEFKASSVLYGSQALIA